MKTLKDIGLKIECAFTQIEYDKHGNEIHCKHSNGYECWKEYDKHGNEIHCKHSNGYEWWKEYDKHGNEIHYKDSNGYEGWKEYDKNGNEIHYKDSNGYEWWLLKEGKLELIDRTYYLDGVQRIVAKLEV